MAGGKTTYYTILGYVGAFPKLWVNSDKKYVAHYLVLNRMPNAIVFTLSQFNSMMY